MDYTVAIDPGLLNWAWIIFDDDGKIYKTRHIKLNNKDNQDKRLNQIYKEIAELSSSENINITSAIIEKQFMNLMIQINGVLKAASDSMGGKTFFFVPSEWKKLVTGKGNVSEDELKSVILQAYPEAEGFDEHRIDCIGIYLAHIKREKEPKVVVLKKPKRVNGDKKPGKN